MPLADQLQALAQLVSENDPFGKRVFSNGILFVFVFQLLSDFIETLPSLGHQVGVARLMGHLMDFLRLRGISTLHLEEAAE